MTDCIAKWGKEFEIRWLETLRIVSGNSVDVNVKFACLFKYFQCVIDCVI